MAEFVLPRVVAVGIYNSQIEVRGRTVTKNRRTAMFEIELPIGAGGVSYIDSEEMPIGENMVICAKPGQIRHTRLPFQCYYIHMTLDEGALYDILTGIPNFTVTERYSRYCELFQELCEAYDDAADSRHLMLYSILLQLIYELAEEARRLPGRGGRQTDRVIEKALSYIRENLPYDLSLRTVAAYVSVSPVHFHNCFKSATGKTLHGYVEEQRIKQALHLLVTTDLTLTDIAYRCGFSSQSYFSYAFKRCMKMTPGAYKKEACRRYHQ